MPTNRGLVIVLLNYLINIHHDVIALFLVAFNSLVFYDIHLFEIQSGRRR